MKELTLIIDNYKYKELKECLEHLNSIMRVVISVIKNEQLLKVHIEYDSNLITPQIIYSEILLLLNMPVMLSFNKHTKVKTSNYKIIKDNLNCEFCFKGLIKELFEIDGIESVESNLDDLLEKDYECDNIAINIKYNPNLISIEEIKQIELNI